MKTTVTIRDAVPNDLNAVIALDQITTREPALWQLRLLLTWIITTGVKAGILPATNCWFIPKFPTPPITTTDTSGASTKYLLRIYQFVAIIPNDATTFTTADLAGSYDLRMLTGGAHTLSASGTISMTDTGTASYSSYTDSSGATALPGDFTLAADAAGNLTNVADTTIMGKLSYFKEMFVVTKTDLTGAYSLSIALKR